MLYYILYINNYSKWIPRPKKPGYSHQNHNCMASIGWDMVKMGWNGSHFEKHGCHVSYISYRSQTNSCFNLFSSPENLGTAPKNVILWTFWVEIGLYQEWVGLKWPFWKTKWPPCPLWCIRMCKLLFHWIPWSSKPGYRHQNHNCMSSIGWDMVIIGWNGSHFEKHGCHVS